MSDRNELIAQAIKICGNQEALAEAAGIRQQTISKLLNGQRKVSGEIAAKIERATRGLVARYRLRPDLWEPPSAKQLEAMRQGIG